MAEGNTLIVHLDLPSYETDRLPLPNTYPMAEPLEPDARQEWLPELVGWWQLGRSKLEQRMPFVHGTRLRRYGGKIDQIGLALGVAFSVLLALGVARRT